MIISLNGSGAPLADQIQDQVRGLINAGMLPAGQKLPSVRQLAGDLGIAPGTVAKAYKALENEGLLVTRIGSGTRVGADASATSADVLAAATTLVRVSKQDAVTLEEAIRMLRAVWTDAEGGR